MIYVKCVRKLKPRTETKCIYDCIKLICDEEELVRNVSC